MAAAVNNICVPAQIDPEGNETMLTEGVILEFIIILILLDDTVFAVKQVPPLIAMSQETTFPFASDVDVKVFVGPFCTLTPLILKL